MAVPNTLEEALEVIDELKADNARFRKKNRELTDKVEEVGDAPTEITNLKSQVAELTQKLSEAEGYKTKYEELDTKYTELNTKVSKTERLEKLKPIFSKFNVTDEKALALAIKEIGEDVAEEGYEDAVKAVVEAYPMLASKPVKSVPDTGKSNEGKATTPVNTQDKLAAGIAERLAKQN